MSSVCWHEHKGDLVLSSRDTARARVPGAGSLLLHQGDGGVVSGKSASSLR